MSLESQKSLSEVSSAFSDEFYEMLQSESKMTALQERLQTHGYTSNTGGNENSDEVSLSTLIPILSDEMRQVLIQTLPDLFAGTFETNVYPDEWHWRAGISRPDATREMCNSWKSSRTIASVVLNENLGKFIADVMQWDSVRIAQDDIVWKPPQPITTQLDYIPQGRRIDTVGFHQDSAYISKQFTPYDNNSVTLWIALDDADQNNGCLEYAVGSHQWQPILHKREGNDEESSDMSSFHGSDEKSYKSAIDKAYAIASAKNNADDLPAQLTKNIQAAPVSAGHAVLHHQDTWHGSGPNTSDTRHRRALVVHFLRGDVTFVEDDHSTATPPLPFGNASYIYGRYKRFNSVEVDETYFPIIYSKNGCDQKRTEWLDDYVTIV
ncbi:unnamed protein product [Cylindrotheca closterium]|uniref:Phytanoyl-CoA dioxygenase family protein n=1 Tax=Cylindrotheca closterium TaxID=2856 RepID=A0AAD2CGC5_9STRA|nr:unnamed protein product [Cylindrotheca closterium]